MIIYLLILNLLATFGIAFIIHIIDEVKKERKNKRKEKFKKDLLEVLKEEQNAKV